MFIYYRTPKPNPNPNSNPNPNHNPNPNPNPNPDNSPDHDCSHLLVRDAVVRNAVGRKVGNRKVLLILISGCLLYLCVLRTQLRQSFNMVDVKQFFFVATITSSGFQIRFVFVISTA